MFEFDNIIESSCFILKLYRSDFSREGFIKDLAAILKTDLKYVILETLKQFQLFALVTYSSFKNYYYLFYYAFYLYKFSIN